MPIRIAIAYHSGFGHTARVARAIALGAQNACATAHIISVDTITEEDWQALDEADAIIFGSPTYMGGVSAPFKAFIDATSKRWYAQAWKDKIAAGFTNSGAYCGDKLSALFQLNVNALQHGMIWVGTGLMPPSNKGKEVLGPDEINRFGSAMGLMTQSNNESPEVTPPEGDIRTAELFGKRIAEVTARFI